MRCQWSAVVLSLVFFAPAAPGATITLDAVNRGVASSGTVFSGSPTANYYVGAFPPQSLNDYFVFDLRGVSDTITAASFRAYNPAAGFATDGTSETVSLLSGAADASHNFSYGGASAYGSRSFTAADNDAFVTFTLGSKFVADANTLRGTSDVDFWGRFDTADTDSNTPEYVFNGTANTPASNTQLILTTVPEPASAALLLFSLGGMAARRRRQ